MLLTSKELLISKDVVPGLFDHEGEHTTVFGNIDDYIPIYIQQDATLHSLFISGNCSTCFRWYLHQSSGAHTTVSTASCTCQTVIATCHYRGRDGTPSRYIFQVVPPPIIRSTYNCIYIMWYFSDRYCYLMLSWKRWNSISSAIAAGSSNGLTSTRCCRYSCMCS